MGKQAIKAMELPRRKGSAESKKVSLRDNSMPRHTASDARTEHRTFYDNPISVQQWAAETDTSASVEFAEYGGSSFPSDALMASGNPRLPGEFPVCSMSVSDVSFPAYNHTIQNNGLCNTDVGLDFGLESHQGHGLGNSMDYSGPQLQYDSWAYPTPSAEDMAFSNSASSYPTVSGDSSVDPRYSDWTAGPLQMGETGSRNTFPACSQALTWSPCSATGPPVSSSISQSSYAALQTHTPLSPAPRDGTWSADQAGNRDEDAGFYPAFSLGEALQIPAPATGFGVQCDAMRFVLSCFDLKLSNKT